MNKLYIYVHITSKVQCIEDIEILIRINACLLHTVINLSVWLYVHVGAKLN